MYMKGDLSCSCYWSYVTPSTTTPMLLWIPLSDGPRTERIPSCFRPSNAEVHLTSSVVQPVMCYSNTYIPLSYLLPNYILPSFGLHIQELWASEFHALTREGNRPMKQQAFT